MGQLPPTRSGRRVRTDRERTTWVRRSVALGEERTNRIPGEYAGQRLGGDPSNGCRTEESAYWVVLVSVVVALPSGTIERDWVARMFTVRVEVAVSPALSVTT